jgi:lysine 2,3-aminomutase
MGLPENFIAPNAQENLSDSLFLSWEAELGLSLRSAEDLAREGLISETEVTRYRPLLRRYKFLLPLYYARLIDKSDPDCPIRRQAVPSLEELEREPEGEFLPDPLQDLNHRPEPRITHRYPSRVLLHLTSNCSMYCRFCFRKTLLNEMSREFFSGSLEEA